MLCSKRNKNKIPVYKEWYKCELLNDNMLHLVLGGKEGKRKKRKTLDTGVIYESYFYSNSQTTSISLLYAEVLELFLT